MISPELRKQKKHTSEAAQIIMLSKLEGSSFSTEYTLRRFAGVTGNCRLVGA